MGVQLRVGDKGSKAFPPQHQLQFSHEIQHLQYILSPESAPGVKKSVWFFFLNISDIIKWENLPGGEYS